MRFLWLTWKDYEHPLAGGAETVLRELCKRLVRDGHEVTLLTAEYGAAGKMTTKDGLTIIRIGRNRYLHSFRALAFYLRQLRNKYDAVIEVVNTAPYFSTLFSGKTPTYLFYHQLAREIWFHETIFPLNRLGFHVLEPVANRLLSKSKAKVITVSDSTKQDLIRYGFRPENISIISEGIELEPVAELTQVKKLARPTILSLGSVRPMKRTLEQVYAFEHAKKTVPKLRLTLAGDADNPYGQKVLAYCKQSPFADDIEYKGRVSTEEKLKLMREAHVITATSIKEGWGLIVTEAASQGTPAVVYDVDGLRDSVRHEQTGLVTEPTPQSLAARVIELVSNEPKYRRIRQAAWNWSKNITFDQSYKDFTRIVGTK
jgi:glycosyltransferase involved in cell wall biosynthesis